MIYYFLGLFQSSLRRDGTIAQKLPHRRPVGLLSQLGNGQKCDEPFALRYGNKFLHYLQDCHHFLKELCLFELLHSDFIALWFINKFYFRAILFKLSDVNTPWRTLSPALQKVALFYAYMHVKRGREGTSSRARLLPRRNLGNLGEWGSQLSI